LDLEDFQKGLAHRVQTLRKQARLRQVDLEEHGLAWKSIQKIEYAATDVKASTLLKLSKAFGISLVELLTFDEPADRGTAKRSRRR
jgi:transcriptional regulator with XRE-family HTH domain